jgi:hypothetical protein
MGLELVVLASVVVQVVLALALSAFGVRLD